MTETGSETGTETGAAAQHLRHVARGGVLGLAGSLAAASSGLLLVLLVSHGYDPHQAGLVFTALAVFAVLSVASGLGVDSGLARLLLRLEAEGRRSDLPRAIWWAAVPACGVAALAATAVAVRATDVAGALGLGAEGAGVLRAVVVTLPFCVGAEVCLAATRALGDIRVTVLVDRLLRAGLQTLVVLVVLRTGGGPALLVAAWGSVYVVSAVLAAAAAVRAVRRRPRPSAPPPDDGADLGRRFWRFTWPRGVAGLAQIGIQKADVLVVAALLSPAHAAAYTVATRFVVVGQLANQAVHQVLQPRFTAILVHDDAATLRRVFGTTTAWGILLVWPFYLAVGALAPAYLSLFGSSYTDRAGIVVVVVMAAAMLLAVASGPVDTLLLMAGRSDLSMVNALLALGVDVGLCLLLVGPLGLPGAALAWAIAVLVRCTLAVRQVRGALGASPVTPIVGTAALVTVLAVGVPLGAAAALGGGAVPTAAGLVVAAVGYPAALRLARHRLHLDVLADALRTPAARPVPVPVP